MDYTIKNLRDVEDSAPKFGFGELQEAHFAGDDLAADQTGLSYHVVKPGQHQGFGHRHENAEEVHLIISGSGRVKLDEELIDVKPLDAIRVGPKVARSFEAGPDGLEYVVFGPHREGDHEMVNDFWSDGT